MNSFLASNLQPLLFDSVSSSFQSFYRNTPTVFDIEKGSLGRGMKLLPYPLMVSQMRQFWNSIDGINYRKRVSIGIPHA